MSNQSIYTFGGTVQAGDGLYIVRAVDHELLTSCRKGEYAYVLTARQMGKSSLMVQTAYKLSDEGIPAVIHDLSKVGVTATPSQWYLSLLDTLEMELGLPCDVSKWWGENAHLSAADRFNRFCRDVLLDEIDGRIVIFLDEIDSTLPLDFTDDFFATLRSLYNGRATEPDLKRLSFVLVGVAQPSDLMKDTRRTPFNIGRHIDLTDFTLDEAAPLATGLPGSAAEKAMFLEKLFYWTNGHPYLTQKLCYALASQLPKEMIVDKTVTEIFMGENSYKDSNIHFVRDMLTRTIPNINHELLLQTYRTIWSKRPPVPDDEKSQIKSHLKLSGIVKRENRMLVVRNRIYEQIFDKVWVKEVRTLSWWDVTPRGVKIAAVVSTLLLITSIAFASLASSNANQAVAQQQTAEHEATRAYLALSTAAVAINEERKSRNMAISQQQTAEAEATRAFIALSTADSAVATNEYVIVAAEEQIEAFEAKLQITKVFIEGQNAKGTAEANTAMIAIELDRAVEQREEALKNIEEMSATATALASIVE